MGVFVGLDGTPEAVLVALAPWRDSLDRVALEAGLTSEWIGGRLVEAGVPAGGVREYLHQCAAADQIPLDLKILDPRCPRAPLRDVVARDHAPISTSALTSSFQPASRTAPARGMAGMSGAVILSGGKQPDVIAEAKLFHQRRDEVTGGQASQPPVLGRDNDIEPVRRMRHQPLPGKPVQREHDGGPGTAERFARFLRREMIPAARGKSVN